MSGAADSVVARLEPRGPFALAQAARFFHDWPGGGSGDAVPDGHLHLAFPLDGAPEGAAVGACVRAEGDALRVALSGPGAAHAEGALAQVARILSLDHDGSGFVPARFAGDRILAELIEDHPGLRPVLFGSPYEAGVWFLLGHRIQMRQTAALRARVAQELGEPVTICGAVVHTVPPPARLARLASFRSLPELKLARLRTLAEAALDGALDAVALRELGREEALARLQALPGVGPFMAEGILLRGAGAVDEPGLHEARNAAAVAIAYGLDGTPTPAELSAIADAWRPYRTWASVLMRVNLDEQVADGVVPRPRMRPRRPRG